MSKRMLLWLVLMAAALVAVTVFSFNPFATPPSEPDRPDRPASPAPEVDVVAPAQPDSPRPSPGEATVAGTALGPEGKPMADAVVRLELDRHVGWPTQERARELLQGLSGEELLAGGRRITAERNGTETRTDRQGRFSFEPITDGPFDLVARCPGFADAKAEKVVKGTKDNVLRLGKGVNVQGSIVSTDGTPIAAAVVKCEDRVVLANDSGAFAVEDLPAQRSVELTVFAAGFSREKKTLLPLGQPGPIVLDAPIVLRPLSGFGGRVFDPEGVPVAHAEVYALVNRGAVTATAFTDEGGRYWFREGNTFGYRDVETFSFTFRHPAYRSGKLGEVTLKKGERRILPDVRLERGGSISGRVVDTEGMPAIRALIQAWPRLAGKAGDWPTGWAMAEGDGSFLLEGLETGSYDLCALMGGCTAAVVKAVEVTAPERTEVTVELSRGLSISGRVIDAKGKPIAGVNALHRTDPELGSLPKKPRQGDGTFASHSRSGPDGRFALWGFAEGQTVDLSFEIEGSTTGWARGVPAGKRDLEVLLSGPGSIAGVLLDDATGRPIPIGEVVLRPAGRDRIEATTDGDGCFVLEKVAPGTHGLTGSAGGYLDGSVEGVVVKESARTEGVEIRLAQGATLSGTVNSEDGTPVVKAEVMIDGPRNHFTQTDDNGRFEFTGLLPARYRLLVSAKGFTQHRLNGVSAPESAPLKVTLTRGGTVRGTVLDGEGSAVADARLRLIGSHLLSRLPSGRTKVDGTFELTGVPPGTYDLIAAIRDAGSIVRTQSARVTVRKGEITEVTVGGRTGPPRATMSGRLLYRGTPFAGGKVAILRVDPGASMADLMKSVRTLEVGATGTFVAEDLAPGRYRVMVTRDGDPFDGPMIDLVIDGAGSIERDLIVPEMMLSGKVTRSDTGAGVRRAELLVVRSDRHRLPITGFSDLFLLMQGRTIAGNDGAFLFERLPDAELSMIVTKTGLAPVILDGLRPGRSPEPLAIEMSPGHGLTVRVKNRQGEPLPDATVIHMDDRGRRFLSVKRLGTVTDHRGMAELRVTPGTYRIAVRSAGYAPIESEVRVSGDRDLSVSLDAGATVQLIVSSPTGPVEGATIAVYRPDGSLQVVHLGQDSLQSGAMGQATDEEGRISLDDLPGGSLRFVATSPTGRTGETEIQVPGGGKASGEIRLR